MALLHESYPFFRIDGIDPIVYIDRALERELTAPPTLGELEEPLRHVLLAPGKRIRPALVLAAAPMANISPEPLLPAALALEMFHAASLIQDDLPCMDDEDQRRGRPSCHQVFGEATALLASDALVLRGLERLLSYPRGADCVRHALRALGANGLTLGQLHDLRHRNRRMSMHDRVELARLKTAPLFRLAGEVVGELVPLPDDVRDKLPGWLEELGVAFQLIDDLLDGEPVDLSPANRIVELIGEAPSALLARLADFVLSQAPQPAASQAL